MVFTQKSKKKSASSILRKFTWNWPNTRKEGLLFHNINLVHPDTWYHYELAQIDFQFFFSKTPTQLHNLLKIKTSLFIVHILSEDSPPSTCHVSHVTCHQICTYIFLLQSSKASWLSVCYQRGPPHLNLQDFKCTNPKLLELLLMTKNWKKTHLPKGPPPWPKPSTVPKLARTPFS